MAIVALPGSPMYEEMVRRQMLNQASAQPAVNTGGIGTTNPLTNPNYANFLSLQQNTGTNYGIVDRQLQNNQAVASMYSGQSQAAGYSPGGGGAGGASGYGGIDPGMLDSINASYDRSRLSHMGTQRAMEKRLRGDFNERFGGAETGFLGRAEDRSRGQLGETLALNEDQRNMALAGARERAEERALRAKEAEQARIDRQRAGNAAAYSQGASYNSRDQYGEGGSPGQYGKADWNASSGGMFGAQFAGPARIPGGGGGGGSSAPPPGAPPVPGQNNQPGGGQGGDDGLTWDAGSNQWVPAGGRP